jgi:acetone monooxygenase (methyl acetate-forming)
MNKHVTQQGNGKSQVTVEFDAIVVGAGVAGLYQLYRLRNLGLKVRVVDGASNVGGTWYWNRYPGARVDSPSHVYQYWFSEEILAAWNWSERFPAQPEIERYLNFVADRCDLRKDIQFKTRITKAEYDQGGKRWLVTTDHGDTVTTQFLVSCTGMLSTPIAPPFPGRDTFRGTVIHTARWPQEGVAFAGKRVGVIGTGATGMQVIQTIASEVSHLTVFQRTAQYAIPMRNPRFTDADRAAYRAQYPELQKQVQGTFAGFDTDLDPRAYRDLSPAERSAALEALWADGSLSFWIGGFRELFTDPEINEEISAFVRAKIRARVKDPHIADLLTPTTHGFGLHRVPLETQYFEAYNRDNIELVDVNQAPIVAFTERGLKTTAREYPLDVIILATGFDAGTGSLARMNVHGRDGRSLAAQWRQDIRSTLGLQVHGYPNLFMVAGPLAPSTAFCNMTTCLQQQVEWITDCIRYVREHGGTAIESTAAKEAEWVAHHDDVANSTLIVKTNSWYMGTNVAGKPRRLLSYIGGVGAYRQRCEEVKASGYQGFVIT